MTVAVRTMWGWLQRGTPRLYTLMLALWLTAASLLAINKTEETRLEQRIESRCALRGVFNDIYDYFDEQSSVAGREPSKAVADLRLRLNDKYPALVPDEECSK